MSTPGWFPISGVDASLICSSVNLMLPRAGFSARSLKRLTVDDPLFRDDLSGVYLDSSGEVRALCVVSVDGASSKAWLKLMCTHQNYMRELDAKIESVTSSMGAMGIREIRASDRAGYHFRAGLEKSQRSERSILRKHGFRVIRSVADIELDLCLFNEFRPLRFAKDGCVFGPPDDPQRLLEFVDHNFGPYWRMETEASLKNGGVVQAKMGDNIVGFASYCGFEDHWFGPTGVLEEFRGRGIGSELLFAALTRMRERGLCRATIPWTEHLTFYGQTDAVVAVKNLEIMSGNPLDGGV
ncbi:hypothetical protein B9Q04_07510 [Candidatus Marsarchaeota G2 archaeon BE_D]|jgi:GNAT superfamily N-acetyltransferase|uniref:N-acetyltransferase domain-containing protein n=1 Tax=Candidatus Marsarchaeota G2 archaeon BE_D TaxID=1978158 RepID=A0A2R6CAZ2_9ARCH|nr:MAG: hypothetical protein B9Q04_07510 [Candidatus Marsarchaeota G2 archaeon BE_D]